jgi:hypothetical protein
LPSAIRCTRIPALPQSLDLAVVSPRGRLAEPALARAAA